jgi:thiol-disulfide isomerase/thioredoxin
MNKRSFWRGYFLGIFLALGLSCGSIYWLFLRQPDIDLAEMGLTELDGTPVDTKLLTGKPVVVNYWATWCAPCIEEFPIFKQSCTQAGATVTFLMISDEPSAKIQQFVRKHPYGFRFLRLKQPLPGVNARPVTYGYDRGGALVAKHSGTFTEPALREFIGSL